MPAQMVRVVPLGDGVMLACDDGCPADRLVEALAEAIRSHPGVGRGSHVVVDLGSRSLSVDELAAVEQTVLELLQPRMLQLVHGEDAAEPAPAGESGDAAGAAPAPEERTPPAMPRAWSLPSGVTQAYVVRRTVRSGQRLTCDGSLVVVGDVNPGAELIASGDILVLGTLRGLAHAGARGHEGAVIAALRLQPVQLRIGPYIGRPPDGARGRPEGWQPERAVVRDGAIVVEPLVPGLGEAGRGPGRRAASRPG